MNTMEPIIPSMLDTDHYKVTMGQLVFNQFASANVRYRFINRSKTPFPEGFAEALREQVSMMSTLQMTGEELQWYRKAVRYLKPTFLEWLAAYRYNPEEVSITQEGGDLSIEIEGPWYRTIYWEVPLMGLVSELYFRLSHIKPATDFRERAAAKADRMASAGVHWADFGSRRRFSLEIQDAINQVMKDYKDFFLGSSNPYICKKYDLTPIGTYAHEGPMAMQSLFSARVCNQMWMDAWVREYQGDLGIALTDTLTTPVFLRNFDMLYAKLFDGVRIDSGDPFKVAEMILAHYQKTGIATESKRFVFSDSLNDTKAIELHNHFSSRCMAQAGIGTFLTNDCGAKPLNIVIKLSAADFGFGLYDLVKLSDDEGKHTGSLAIVEHFERELGLLRME